MDHSISQLVAALYVSRVNSGTVSHSTEIIMYGSASSPDDHTVHDHAPTTDWEPSDPPALEAMVVRYENQPDRCTISPADCSDEAKLTTWLTADIETFVRLDDMR